VSKQQIVDELNRAMNREVAAFLRHMLQAASIKGAQWDSARRVYQAGVTEEVEHAQYLADKIVMLGGTPMLRPDLMPPAQDVREMLKGDIREPDLGAIEKRAVNVGLDPATSNILQVCCAECGLDPEHASCLDLAAAKMGKKPSKIPEQDAIDFFGEGWVFRVCA
jgi:hypothetical protein